MIIYSIIYQNKIILYRDFVWICNFLCDFQSTTAMINKFLPEVQWELIKKNPELQAKILFPISKWTIFWTVATFLWPVTIGYVGYKLYKRHQYVKLANERIEREELKELLDSIERLDNPTNFKY